MFRDIGVQFEPRRRFERLRRASPGRAALCASLVVLLVVPVGCFSPLFSDAEQYSYEPESSTVDGSTGADADASTDSSEDPGNQVGACCLRRRSEDFDYVCQQATRRRCNTFGWAFLPEKKCGLREEFPCCLDGKCELKTQSNCIQEEGTPRGRNCSCDTVSCGS